jgi:protease AXL1
LSPNTDLLVSAWCNIVGDESKGSLDQYLKSKGFSLALSAFSQNLSVGNSILIVEIKLTNTGIKNLKIIVALLLSRYKSEVFQDVHELARVLFELESIDILNYLHQDTNKSPMEEASRYAQTFLTNLKSLKPKNLLKGSNNWDSMHNLGSVKGDLFWPGKGEAFFKFINDVFNLDNLKLVVLGDLKVLSTVMSDVSVDGSSRSDQFFNFDYKVGKFKPESFSSSIIQENSFKFEIIPRNPFIPKYALDHSNLQKLLLESTEQSSLASLSFVTKSIWSSTIAKLTKKEQNYEIWTKLEPSKIFNSKLFISFDIVLLDIESNPENTMMTEIITELLKFKISSMLYASELVNYTWEIQASLKGDVRFGFTVSGYSEGIDHLINIIIDEFLQLYEDPVSVDEFRKSRVAVRSRYKELEQNNSLSMAISGLLVVLEENMWTLEDRLDSLDDIDIDSLKNFLQSFFKDNDKYTKIFIHGDIQDTESISKSINKLSNHLNSKENKVLSFEEPSTHSISPGKAYNIKRKGAKGDPMNSISFFIETGPRGDYKTRQITRLLSYLMSLTLVPDLRFKKQLGYAVLGGTRILRSTYGIHISIMSGTFTPQYLEDKINEYLLSWEKTYINMTDKEFQTTVIEPFLKNFKIDLTKSGGPESLTAEMPSSVSCSNVANAGESMRIHKWIRDLISAKSYQGAESNEDEDSEFFNSLTRLEFLKFFQSRVSSKFKTRSQLSVMIKSQLSTEETQQQLIQLQLEAFLKMNGLRISSEQLKQIVGSAKGNPVFLLKDLFKYFMSQGESFKLCAIVLKEAVKQVFEGVKHYKSNYSETSNHNDGEGVKSGDITDIREFQKQNPVYHIK